jgi:hypothetical protein
MNPEARGGSAGRIVFDSPFYPCFLILEAVAWELYARMIFLQALVNKIPSTISPANSLAGLVGTRRVVFDPEAVLVLYPARHEYREPNEYSEEQHEGKQEPCRHSTFGAF